MTAPLPVDVDWPAVITAGIHAVYGVHVQVEHAAPLVWSPWGSVVGSHDERLWPVPAQPPARVAS